VLLGVVVVVLLLSSPGEITFGGFVALNAIELFTTDTDFAPEGVGKETAHILALLINHIFQRLLESIAVTHSWTWHENTPPIHFALDVLAFLCKSCLGIIPRLQRP
jgi:hypothetical protein